MTQLVDHSTAREVRIAMMKCGGLYAADSTGSGWAIQDDPEMFGGVIVSYEEKPWTSYACDREEYITGAYARYTEVLQEAGFVVERREDGTLAVHMPTELEQSFVRMALAEAREAVESLSPSITTRKAGLWSIFVIFTDEDVPERSRRGELSFQTEGGYKFRTFFHRPDRRTRDLKKVVGEVKEELVDA